MCHVINSDSGAGEKVSVIWETKWKKIKVRRDKWVTEATWTWGTFIFGLKVPVFFNFPCGHTERLAL